MRCLILAPIAATVAALLACNSSSSVMDGESATTSGVASTAPTESSTEGDTGTETESSSTSDASGTESESSESSDTSDESTSTSGGDCSDYLDTYGNSLVVTIQNNRSVPVFVELHDECNMRVLGPLSDGEEALPQNTLCQTCEGFFDNTCECPDLPPPPCFESAGLKLEPMGSFMATIGTTGWTEHDFPTPCAEGDCPLTCFQAHPLPDGPYVIRARVSEAVTCDGGGCDCVADYSGACFIEADGGLSGTIETVQQPVDIPIAGAILSIDP